MNNDVSYRVSDNDAVSFWEGNNITVKLDRCYGAKAVKVTASGNVKITYGCSKGVTSAVTESFSDKETKNIFVDSNVSYVKLESTTSDEITVYDLKVYADIKNARIGKMEPEQVEVISQYVKIIDLGREVIIDHIEPCNLSVEVATKEDFDDVSIISGCGPANVAARYIGVSSSADISVVGYESPKLVNSPSGKSVEFVSELYGGDNNTAIACYYVEDVQVLNNHITECNYSGISMGWGWDDYPDSVTCRRNRIAYNYIENYNLVATDGGAIYLLGQQPGTVIENNYMVQHKVPMQKTGICGVYPDEGSAYMTIRNNVIDMAEISNYGGAVRDINMWTHTVKDNFAHSNYVTYTNIRNDGTNCIVDTPVVFENAVKPTAVEKIIAESAINLD